MSTRPAIGVGGIVGGVVAFVVVAAIVASPIYLNALRAPEAALDSTIEGPVEEVRRAILNLDENLALMNTIAADSDIKSSGSKAAELSKDLDELLKQSTAALQLVQQADENRKTVIEGAIQTGQPKVPGDFNAKYLAAHKKLLSAADTAVRNLTSAVAAAEPSASANLSAARIQAMLEYAKGQIERNRAEFEAWQAAELRRGASELVNSVAGLQGVSRALAGEVPELVITNATARIDRLEKAIAEKKSTASDLKQAIGESEARIQALESKAVAARIKMSELENAGAAIHGEDGEYARLSKDARAAEAEADALRNGTLAGATRTNSDLQGDLLATRYEGGEAKAGARDLQDRLDLLDTEIAVLEKNRDNLIARRIELTKHRDDLRTQAKASANAAEDQLAQVDNLLADAQSRQDAAHSAAETAVKAFAQADSQAKKAALGAQGLKTLAQNRTAPEGSSLAELNRLVREDGDTAAAVICISAESDYNIALLRTEQIEWIREHQDALAAISARIGRDAPQDATDKIDNLRVTAIAKIADANKEFEKAAKEINASRSTVNGVAIQGKDYKWQVQLGQAAVHLLSASLAATDEERHAEQDAAYELLKESIQGREQSPALQKAVKSFELLQRTAR